MKRILLAFSLILGTQMANANVCVQDSYKRVADKALNRLAEFENTKVDISSLTRNLNYAGVNFANGYQLLGQKLEEAATPIEKTRIKQERENLAFDFCFQEVFHTEGKLKESRELFENIDYNKLEDEILNLDIWGNWCRREGKGLVANELESISNSLKQYRDTQIRQSLIQLDVELKNLEWLDVCQAIYR